MMGSRVPRNGNPDRVLENEELCLNFDSKRFGIGFLILRNTGTHHEFPQHEKKNMSKG